MGTYIYKPTSVFQNLTAAGFWKEILGDGTSDADLLSGINDISSLDGVYLGNVGGPNSGTLLFLGDFFLDGSLSPTPFASLPAGFTPTSCQLSIQSTTNPFPGPDITINVHFGFDVDRPWSGTLVYTKDYNSPVPSALDINTFIGFDEVKTMNVTGPGFFDLTVSGNYSLLAYSWDIPQSGSNVEVGDIISITSPGTNPLTDLDLTQLTISLACGTVVPITQTKTLFTFKVPGSCSGNGATAITATGNGVQFSGSVPLGSITILLTNASGIYTLTPGATHDTLYSSLRDGTTRNVKIPDPFAKTGYVGG
jgi:hypothetical protein